MVKTLRGVCLIDRWETSATLSTFSVFRPDTSDRARCDGVYRSLSLGCRTLADLLTFGEIAYPQAGVITQIVVTIVLAPLFFFMPSAKRILSLEHAHRFFQ